MESPLPKAESLNPHPIGMLASVDGDALLECFGSRHLWSATTGI
jgi:hypothetical protein